MRFYGMDAQLIEIYNIRNLESIKVWDLAVNVTSKSLIIPAILIIYDGGKIMNLCAKDKYFDIFVKKVLEVYHDERNHILEDSLSDPFRLHSKILCDEHSALILDQETIYNIKDIYQFYRDKDAYHGSLLFQKNEVERFLPMVIYHLEQLFSITDQTIRFYHEISGYRDNYIISAKVEGADMMFPVSFNKISDNEYLFQIGGIYKGASSTDLHIKFEKERIVCIIKIGSSIVSTTEYKIVNGAIKMIHDVEKDGITLRYFNSDLEKAAPGKLDNLKGLDHEDCLDWYCLPWTALYGARVNISNLSDTEKIIEISSQFIDYDDHGFINQEFYSMNYRRNKTATIEGENLLLDQFSKSMMGVAIDQEDSLFVIETRFDDSTSDYYTNSQYFYHGCFSKNGIQGITKNQLVPLGRDQDMINAGDLSNKYRLKTLVKGE